MTPKGAPFPRQAPMKMFVSTTIRGGIIECDQPCRCWGRRSNRNRTFGRSHRIMCVSQEWALGAGPVAGSATRNERQPYRPLPAAASRRVDFPVDFSGTGPGRCRYFAGRVPRITGVFGRTTLHSQWAKGDFFLARIRRRGGATAPRQARRERRCHLLTQSLRRCRIAFISRPKPGHFTQETYRF